MKSKLLLMSLLLVSFLLLGPALMRAQAVPGDIKPILAQRLQPPQVVTFQLQHFLMGKVPKLPHPSSAAEWTAEERRIRSRVLQNVVYHGWPSAWVSSSPDFQDLGTVPTAQGYTLHKLRYEIVPGFYTTALLYEPSPLHGRVPAVLDVMGHFPALGNKEEFEQKLCINQALKGMIALNPEWIDMGELNTKGNQHEFAASLDLVGMNGVGLFYLAMRRGLDYLARDPNVDASRIAVTGLSGGGWETITLSTLDPRVNVSIPVAGYTTLEGRFERLPGEPGDNEQNPTDFLVGQDYSTLTAIRAPRPALLIYNAEDNCCFRAPLVKPYVYDAVKPFYALYGKENNFQFYQSTLISAHNYGLEDRDQAYRFLVEHFHLAASPEEIPVGQDLKSYDQLLVGVPQNNLTILGLARKMASKLTHSSAPGRSQLQEVVRYHPVSVAHTWMEDNTYHNQVESLSYRWEMSNGLPATGVWMQEVQTKPHAPLTIVLNDGGKKAAGTEVWDRVPEVADCMERGESVVVADVLFTGDDVPAEMSSFAQMLAAVGERPLGIEAAQLIGLAHWAQSQWAPSRIRLETSGIRTQVIALVAAALAPHLFSEVEDYGGMRSLGYLLAKPVLYDDAPDLFCLDLYKDFDIDQLKSLASPARVVEQHYVPSPSTP
ncbi:MAG: alpha/beta hydrolase family protein [Terriglobia bacterium]